MAEISATTKGDLGRTPFGHLLVYALDKRLTGALFLTEASGVEHAVRLVRGAPVKVRPGDRWSLLGEMLVEAGAIDEGTMADALATPGLLGDMLLLADRIERDVLENIAEQQFLRRMVRLFSLPPSTAYRYCDGHEELREYGGDPARVDPLALLWAGLRAHGEASALMEATLSLLGEAPMRLHPLATTARFGLEGAEARLREHLGAMPTPLAELIGLGAAPPDAVRRFAYALLITRQLDLGAGADPPLGCTVGAQAAPSTVVARMHLRSQLHRVGAAAPDLPGAGERGPVVLARKTRADAARSAEKEAPPDDADDRASGEAPASSVVPIDNARAALRADAPLSPMEPGPWSKSSAEVSVELDEGVLPTELFQLVSDLLAEQDYPGALDACECALEAAPDDPDFLALAVWARAQMGGADVKALMVELNEVLREHEAHVDARFHRAMLRMRLSDQAGAIRDLKRVLELSPAHTDAADELALLEARQPAKHRPSLFGRLFKR
jgi:hypothetical protein